MVQSGWRFSRWTSSRTAPVKAAVKHRFAKRFQANSLKGENIAAEVERKRDWAYRILLNIDDQLDGGAGSSLREQLKTLTGHFYALCSLCVSYTTTSERSATGEFEQSKREKINRTVLPIAFAVALCALWALCEAHGEAHCVRALGGFSLCAVRTSVSAPSYSRWLLSSEPYNVLIHTAYEVHCRTQTSRLKPRSQSAKFWKSPPYRAALFEQLKNRPLNLATSHRILSKRRVKLFVRNFFSRKWYSKLE